MLIKTVIVYAFSYLGHFSYVTCLENGLALTPPMGWLAWERFKCNTNCDSDPDNCISENLFVTMADRLVEDGYKNAGYVHVNIDDCWMAPARDSKGKMDADSQRFPQGIPFLAHYMHERGLKLGIYQNFGVRTCMGYPGIVGHMKEDSEAFAQWQVDMVKLDACHSHPSQMNKGYIAFGRYLNETKRPIVYSCSWPYYLLVNEIEPNYQLVSKHCNLWRNFHDIQDSWESIVAIIDYLGDNQEILSSHVRPGSWSDPDMLMIGNFHLTPGQARVQMAVWCILPAPLLMSNDLRSIKPVFKSILLNTKAISINQDPLGLSGKVIYKNTDLEIWTKLILPSNQKETSLAILFLNKSESTKVSKIVLKELGLHSPHGYLIWSVFQEKHYGFLLPNATLTLHIAAMDVIMLKCELVIQ